MLGGKRNGDRGQDRAEIGGEYVDLVLGDQLVVERRCRRGRALVVIGGDLDRDFLVERLDENAAVFVDLRRPVFEPLILRLRGEGERSAAGIERAVIGNPGASAACGRRFSGA